MLSTQGKRTKPRRLRGCTQGKLFNNIVGWVIVANAGLLALEADLGLLSSAPPEWVGLEADMNILAVGAPGQEGFKDGVEDALRTDMEWKANVQQVVRDKLKKDIYIKEDIRAHNLRGGSAYNIAEYMFTIFFAIELCLRFCDVGFEGYCRNKWCLFDVSLVVAGLLELVLPLFIVTYPASPTDTAFTVLRLMRVFRVFRLFRMFRGLKTIGQAFAKAFSTVLCVGALLLVLNFIAAILLTSLVGQASYRWKEQAVDIERWFGSIGRSMQTLFAVMTFSDWSSMAAVLTDVIPGIFVVPAIVLYIVLCTFTMISLVSGVIGDSFITARRGTDKRRELQVEDRRAGVAAMLSKWFLSFDHNRTGTLNREAFAAALDARPEVLPELKKSLDIDTNVDDLLHLHERLSQVAGGDDTVRIESLAEAMTHLGGTAKASRVFDLKYFLQALRREMAERSAQMWQELSAREKEVKTVMTGTAKHVEEVQAEVAKVQQEVATVRSEVATICSKFELLEKQQAMEQRNQSEQLAAMNQKLDALTAQLATQAMANEKFDALSQLVGHFAAQMSTQYGPLKGGTEPGSTMFVSRESTKETECSLVASLSPGKLGEQGEETDVGQAAGSTPPAETGSTLNGLPQGAPDPESPGEAGASGKARSKQCNQQ